MKSQEKLSLKQLQTDAPETFPVNEIKDDIEEMLRQLKAKFKDELEVKNPDPDSFTYELEHLTNQTWIQGDNLNDSNS